jgi:hypothetical protein
VRQKHSRILKEIIRQVEIEMLRRLPSLPPPPQSVNVRTDRTRDEYGQPYYGPPPNRY